MPKIQKCTTCKFKEPTSEWDVSLKGKKVSSCIKCSDYHRNHRQDTNEARLKAIEMLNLRYNTDEVYRRSIADRYANREVVYIICDYCGKELRDTSLAPHLLCCKRKKSPELAMLERLCDAL